MERKKIKKKKDNASGLFSGLSSAFAKGGEDAPSAGGTAENKAPVSGQRYSFRVMKRSEYLAKQAVAEQILNVAGDMSLDEDDLEALLQNYLSSVKKPNEISENDSVTDATSADVTSADVTFADVTFAGETSLFEEASGKASVPEESVDTETDEEFVLEISDADEEDEGALHLSVQLPPEEETVTAEESVITEETAAAEETVSVSDPALPLTEELFTDEEPVFEDVETEHEELSADGIDEGDTDIEDLLSELPDDLIGEISAAASEETDGGTAAAFVDTEEAEQTALTEEDLLMAADLFDEIAPTEETDTEEPMPEDDLFSELLPESDGPVNDSAVSGSTVIGSVPAGAETGTEESEKKTPEELLAEEALAGAASEGEKVDKTDIDLMIAFGMDEQLEQTVGKEEAARWKDDHYKKMHEGDRPDTVHKKHAEYVSSSQTREIFTEFREQYSSVVFRFLGACVFLILLFLFENSALLHLKMPAVFDREQYPLVYTLFDLQLVLLCFSMVRGSILTGVGAIFRGRPVPESITGFLFLGSIVYTAAAAAMCPMHDLQLYNFPIALAVIFALCFEYMNLRRRIMSFRIISSKKLKYAVDAVGDRDGGAELAMFSDYIADDPSMFRIRRTAFVDGFFERTETYPRTQRILRVILPAVFLLILAFFASDFILTGSLYQALSVSYITLLLTLPSCTFIAFGYPMYRASSYAYQRESALIGEASLGEYADASVISFDDKEVFPASGIRFSGVKVYGNNRIDHVIYAAASVFRCVGGPLAEVFETATGELGYSENVVLTRVDPDGIEARVDGGAVLIGRMSFMNRYGYSLTLSESEKAMEETGNASILYIAYDNQITSKLYVQYTVDAEFETVLKQLYRQGICVGIKSSDPNIDDHLLSCKIKMSKYPVRIIKCSQPKETAVVVDRLSSGIVSKSGAKSLLRTLAVCDRVLNASRTNNVITVVSMLLGMAAMVFFTLSGMPLLSAPLWIALYQLFWIVPVIAVTRYQI